jgi:hypothetical protein
MHDQPTKSNNAFFLNDKPSSTHQLVVESITNKDSQGSTNDGPAYFMQLSVPNDGPAYLMQLSVPNDSHAKQHPIPNHDGPALEQLSVHSDSPAKQHPVPNDTILQIQHQVFCSYIMSQHLKHLFGIRPSTTLCPTTQL